MKPISFRLRKNVDDDLIAALQKTETSAIADLCRNGLRLMLGIRTTRQAKIEERPIVLPKSVTVKIGGNNNANRGH